MPPPPSAKSLGKLRVPNADNHATPHTPPPEPTPAAPAAVNGKAAPPPKRVLPSRSRRGGPGVGNSDIDLMIMEGLERAAQYKPILPPTARFCLTTDSSKVPPAPPPDEGSTSASYFDKPEVIKSWKEQAVIQTPEFWSLSEDASVGSRLRVRGAEEESADTSDLAYERRHRKYETFEKRQRRREKEKLIHEQYKLKERLEQLRGMDASAFGPPGATVAELEEKRRIMLREGEELERRYEVLLPSDRKALRKAIEEDEEEQVDEEEQEVEAEVEEVVPSPPIKLKIRIAPRKPSSAVPSSPSLPPSAVSTVTRRPSINQPQRDAAGRVLPPQEPGKSRTPSGSPAPQPRNTTRQPYTKRARFIPVLLQAAARNTAEPNAKRKTSRNVLAFGMKIPPAVEEAKDFELPDWLVNNAPEEVVDVDMQAEPPPRYTEEETKDDFEITLDEDQVEDKMDEDEEVFANGIHEEDVDENTTH